MTLELCYHSIGPGKDKNVEPNHDPMSFSQSKMSGRVKLGEVLHCTDEHPKYVTVLSYYMLSINSKIL